jgi:hypothetical protein
MRHVVALGLFFAGACSPSSTGGALDAAVPDLAASCSGTPPLYLCDTNPCCDACQAATNGAPCTPPATCYYGFGAATGGDVTANCLNGTWIFTHTGPRDGG